MDIFIIGAASRRDFVRLRRSRRRRRLPGAGPIGPTGPPRDINIDENDAFIPRTTSPSAVKKPEDLSGRGLPTTAISERIVHQVESGSGFPRSSFGPITSRESLYYVSLILYYVYLLLSFFFLLPFLFLKNLIVAMSARSASVRFVISVVKTGLKIRWTPFGYIDFKTLFREIFLLLSIVHTVYRNFARVR